MKNRNNQKSFMWKHLLEKRQPLELQKSARTSDKKFTKQNKG